MIIQLKFSSLSSILLSLFFFLGCSFLHAQNWTITEVSNLPVRVSNNAVCEGFIGNIPYLFSFAGIDSTKTPEGIHLKSYRYNTETGDVLRLPDVPDTMGKIGVAASEVNGVIYIIGGYHVFPNFNELTSEKVHRYDIVSNTFLADGASLIKATDDHVQAVYKDSLIYVVTGWSNTGNITNVQIYDTYNNSWQAGTSLPNSHAYKSFGASGTIVGDTIFYFGGAQSIGSFGPQNRLRKGVINPNDPTEIVWSTEIPDTQITGYRAACTSVDDQVHWIGGSLNTYNFDGLAYNNGLGVPPANRDLTLLHTTPYSFDQDFSTDYPMDLRGIASISDTVKYLAGGMLANQTVSNTIYKLEWNNILVSSNQLEQSDINFIHPNPISDVLNINLEYKHLKDATIRITNTLGETIFQTDLSEHQSNLDLSHLPTGLYLVELINDSHHYLNRFVKY